MTTAPTTPRPIDPNDFLMGGGDGVPSAKFPDPGVTLSGTITAPPKAYQEREYNKVTGRSDGEFKTFPSGDPIMGLSVDVQTTERDLTIEGDTGLRRLYIQGKLLKQTIREAIVAAGGKGLEPGAHLSLTFTHRDDPMDKGSAKNYTAVYTTAGNVQMMGAAPAAVPAPVQYAQPVAAPVQYAQPVAAPAPAYVPPVQAQIPVPVAAPAPAPVAAPAPAADPVSQARQLFTSGLSDAQIGAAVGLDVVVIGALRAQG